MLAIRWMLSICAVSLFALALGLYAPIAADSSSEGPLLWGADEMREATFAAGCFWGVEEAFRHVEGVTETTVGYTGGDRPNPTYQEVCGGETGHAEAVRVVYDPESVSYEELLGVFWDCHDPTRGGWRGVNSRGQYRSAVFYHDEGQRRAAERSKRALEESGRHERPIATLIEPASKFWPAEDYHQDYHQKQRGGACPL